MSPLTLLTFIAAWIAYGCTINNDISDQNHQFTVDTLRLEGAMGRSDTVGARWRHEVYHNPVNDKNEWRSWIEISNRRKYLRPQNKNKGGPVVSQPLEDPCEIDPGMPGCNFDDENDE